MINRFELHGDVTYVDFDDSQTVLSVGALYTISGTALAIGLGLSRSDEATVADLGVRLYFGS